MKSAVISLFLLISVAGMSQHKGTVTVYFDFNKHNLAPGAKNTLDSFLLAVKPDTVNIELSGHCDAIGSDDYNDQLSTKRVSAVRNYLLANGLLPDNILAANGFGERNPVNQNRTAAERRLNRRVEILITEISRPSTIVQPEPKAVEVPEKEVTEEKEMPLQQKITDPAIVAGSTIILKNINFYGGMHRLLPESLPAVKELLEVMKANPTLVIEVQGHICCQPGPEDGYDVMTGTRSLSEERAFAIHKYLISHFIEPKRVSYKGFGHSRPVYPYPETSKEEETANRRVEIKIVSK